MDVLTDVLSNLRLQGEMYFRTEFQGHWGVSLPSDRETIRFHLIVQGQCWITVDGCNEPLLLREGDFALIPHGSSQILADSPDATPVALNILLGDGKLGEDGVLRHGSNEMEQQVRLVCGFCSFDEGLDHPLFYGLPPVLLLGRNFTGSSPWLAEAVRVMMMEADLDGEGSSAVINRLIEVLFIQGIRHRLDTNTSPGIPFMLAITNSKLKPAIEAMHEHPEIEWTLTRLAELTNMSRGRFAQRFKAALDQSPMRYLTNWRLQKARRLLKETNLSIVEVAFRSGYQSLPSFTRRFSKQFGIGPAAFRKLP